MACPSLLDLLDRHAHTHTHTYHGWGGVRPPVARRLSSVDYTIADDPTEPSNNQFIAPFQSGDANLMRCIIPTSGRGPAFFQENRSRSGGTGRAAAASPPPLPPHHLSPPIEHTLKII
eukprot:GHVU01189477.1.p2 GENE.GHVU01189477.1~~GHVU01189477.1.p2  ORF type:complete len:118 (+),score=20.12 GHVU01189477.1:164-517(+)